MLYRDKRDEEKTSPLYFCLLALEQPAIFPRQPVFLLCKKGSIADIRLYLHLTLHISPSVPEDFNSQAGGDEEKWNQMPHFTHVAQTPPQSKINLRCLINDSFPTVSVETHQLYFLRVMYLGNYQESCCCCGVQAEEQMLLNLPGLWLFFATWNHGMVPHHENQIYSKLHQANGVLDVTLLFAGI